MYKNYWPYFVLSAKSYYVLEPVRKKKTGSLSHWHPKQKHMFRNFLGIFLYYLGGSNK